jgi:DNA-binding NarL/FixJ family response regulator
MPLVIIADDHPLFRAALRQAVQGALPTADIAEADQVPGLQSLLEQHDDADLLLLDLHMPGAHGFSSLIFVQAHYPALPVLVVSAHDAPDIMRRAIDHGAAGFLPKSSNPAAIAEAISTVLTGEMWLPEGVSTDGGRISDEEQSTADALASLTPQQFRVATMLAEGLLNKQIAYELNVTEATIKAHMTTILRKLGVRSRTQAVLALARLDVTPPGQDSLQR